MVNGLPSKQKWLVRVWLFANMKKINKLIKYTKKYNIIVIGLFLLILGILEMFFFAFVGFPSNMLRLFPIFNAVLFCIILDLKIIVRLYVIYRFLRKTLAKKYKTS